MLWAKSVVGAEHYSGHSVSAIFVAAFPAIIHVHADLEDVWQRILFACCGGLGAFLAIIGDRPKHWQDFASRIVCGVISCFLFGPYLARRFGYAADIDGVVLVFGIIGVASWYLVGSVTDGLTKLRSSGRIWTFFNAKAGVTLVDPTPSPDPDPKETPEKPK